MNFVAGFVAQGPQFLKSGELELVAVIFMWNPFEALESKLEGAAKCKAVGKTELGISFGPPTCGFIF